MKETKKEVIIELDLRGFDKKDIKIKLADSFLQIVAEKSFDSEVKKKDFLHKENTSKTFSYETSLPKIIPNKSKIQFNNGILRIIAPKAIV